MTSRSPQRHTFQKERYIERCREKGEEPNQDYLDTFQKILMQEQSKFQDPKDREHNLEYDLLTTNWILEKVRSSESYAQNIYAALCNNGFTKLDVIPILTEQEWSCSWRYAGGIVADMREEGDYNDWYCSGIRDYGEYDNNEAPKELTEEQLARLEVTKRYVPEGKITPEVREDFKRLGWIPAKGGDWENFE